MIQIFARARASLYGSAHPLRPQPTRAVASGATIVDEDLKLRRSPKHLQAALFLRRPQQHAAVVRSTGAHGRRPSIFRAVMRGSVWPTATNKWRSLRFPTGARTALAELRIADQVSPHAWAHQDLKESGSSNNCQYPQPCSPWGDPGARTLEQYIPITQKFVAVTTAVPDRSRSARRMKYETGVSSAFCMPSTSGPPSQWRRCYPHPRETPLRLATGAIIFKVCCNGRERRGLHGENTFVERGRNQRPAM